MNCKECGRLLEYADIPAALSLLLDERLREGFDLPNDDDP